jgi:predicted RNase H-like HicB family nuclease
MAFKNLLGFVYQSGRLMRTARKYVDKTDNVYVVDVPELPGCMAHGKSKKEALENAEKSVAFWLNTAKEDGIQIPEPKGRLMYA